MKPLGWALLMLTWVGVASAERLPVRAYSTIDGLANNEIHDGDHQDTVNSIARIARIFKEAVSKSEAVAKALRERIV